MTVCQEGEGGPAAGVGVVDEGEDGDGLVEALLLDERVDGAGVLAVLDVELVHAAAIQCAVSSVSGGDGRMCPVSDSGDPATATWGKQLHLVTLQPLDIMQWTNV